MSCRSSLALVRNTAVDAIGINGGALHALWTLEGLGALADPAGDAYRAAVGALKHPAAGVRKAAAMVLPKTAAVAAAIVDAGLLRDPDLHTRLAATLVLADMPPAPAIGAALYAASRVPENYTDRWLSRALFIAATRHRDTLLTVYNADPAQAARHRAAAAAAHRRPEARLARAAGRLRPARGRTCRCRATGSRAAFPTSTASSGSRGRSRGPPARATPRSRSDGSATPRKCGSTACRSARLAAAAGGGGGGGRGGPPPAYVVPAGTLKAGANVLTVRVTNGRNDGGFLGLPDSMHADAPGQQPVPLAGALEVPRRAPDQRGRALLEAGRAERARRLRRVRHRRRRRARVAAAGRHAGARRRAAARRRPRPDEVRPQRADRHRRAARRSGVRERRRDAAQFRARRRRVARRDWRSRPTRWRRRPPGWRRSTSRRFRRCSRRAAWSIPVRPRRFVSARRRRRARIPTSARSRLTGAS